MNLHKLMELSRAAIDNEVTLFLDLALAAGDGSVPLEDISELVSDELGVSDEALVTRALYRLKFLVEDGEVQNAEVIW